MENSEVAHARRQPKEKMTKREDERRRFGLRVTLGSSVAAHAGRHTTVDVEIRYDEAGTSVIGAAGALSTAYQSADDNQLIGCGGSTTSMWCQAHDARPDEPGLLNGAWCSTTDPELIAQIRSVSPESYIRFYLDPATGQCTSIYVSHNSSNLRL